MKLSWRCISKGQGKSPLLKSPNPISFLSDVDSGTGFTIEKGYPLGEKNITNAVLAFEYGKELTTGCYIFSLLSKRGHAPRAIMKPTAIVKLLMRNDLIYAEV